MPDLPPLTAQEWRRRVEEKKKQGYIVLVNKDFQKKKRNRLSFFYVYQRVPRKVKKKIKKYLLTTQWISVEEKARYTTWRSICRNNYQESNGYII